MIGDNRHQGEVVAPEDKLLDMAQKAAAMASSAELLAEAISILKQILKILETLDLDIQLDGKSLKNMWLIRLTSIQSRQENVRL